MLLAESAPAAAAAFGLSARALGLLRGAFASEPRICRAIVYGSRAMGNYRRGSDIDIALDAPNLPFDALLHLHTKIDDLLLPWQVDLSLLHHIDNPELLAHIARVGQSLFET